MLLGLVSNSVVAEGDREHLTLLPLPSTSMCGYWLLKRKDMFLKNSFPGAFFKQPCLEVALLEVSGWRNPLSLLWLVRHRPGKMPSNTFLIHNGEKYLY